MLFLEELQAIVGANVGPNFVFGSFIGDETSEKLRAAQKTPARGKADCSRTHMLEDASAVLLMLL